MAVVIAPPSAMVSRRMGGGIAARACVDIGRNWHVHQVFLEVQIPGVPFFQGNSAGDHVPRGVKHIGMPFCVGVTQPACELGHEVQHHYASGIYIGTNIRHCQTQKRSGLSVSVCSADLSGDVGPDPCICRHYHINLFGR